MKYIFLILAILCLFAQSRFGWVLDGQIAVAAADQAKIGSSYAEARTTMAIWEFIRLGLFISGLTFAALFVISFFPKKKTKQQPNEE